MPAPSDSRHVQSAAGAVERFGSTSSSPAADEPFHWLVIALPAGLFLAFLAVCAFGVWVTTSNTPTRPAQAQIAVLTNACKMYHADHQRWPQNLEELTQPPAAGLGPYVEPKSLTDPWQRPYHYDASGPHHAGQCPDIWCEAPDRSLIANWQ